MDNNRDMNIAGKIKLIGQTKTIGNGFKKRDFVVLTNDKYPQSILVEMTQENCDALDRFNPGDEVSVAINLRGREWTSPQGEVKYFNTIQGWKVEPNQGEVTTAQHSPDREDDLPF
jgi:hypothetical protein